MIILCKKKWENPKGIHQHIVVADIMKVKFFTRNETSEIIIAANSMLKKINKKI